MSVLSHESTKARTAIRILLAVALILPLAGRLALAQQNPGSAELITQEQLRDYLSFIASDEMEGRRAPSRGLDLTAKFIAMTLSRWGLKPAGDDGTFLQMIELASTMVDTEGSFVEVDGKRFEFGDFLASATSGTGSGQVAFAGHGWVVPGNDINAYEGLDVRGKVVVVTGGFPSGLTRGDRSGEGVQRPAQYLAENGAAAMITVPNARVLQRWQRSVDTAGQRGSTTVVGLDSGGGGPAIPSVTASAAMVEALFAGAPVSGEEILAAPAGTTSSESFVANTTATVNVAVNVETIWTQNVVGIIEGSDPELQGEYVALGAHYDHMGVGNPVDGDAIYNGADDDGSGTTAVLAIAEAFAKGERPKRSIMFVWHTGEEAGMWGSRYINEKMPVPPRQVVAALNIDMIGRSKAPGDTNPANEPLTGPNEVYVVGPGVMSAELGEILDEVNDSYLGLEYNSLYDVTDHPERIFFRSDHITYARNGIPIAFFFTGTHEDYHRPSDEVDKIDFVKMQRIAQTIYASAWELANREGRPGVNDVLPEAIRR